MPPRQKRSTKAKFTRDALYQRPVTERTLKQKAKRARGRFEKDEMSGRHGVFIGEFEKKGWLKKRRGQVVGMALSRVGVLDRGKRAEVHRCYAQIFPLAPNKLDKLDFEVRRNLSEQLEKDRGFLSADGLVLNIEAALGEESKEARAINTMKEILGDKYADFLHTISKLDPEIVKIREEISAGVKEDKIKGKLFSAKRQLPGRLIEELTKSSGKIIKFPEHSAYARCHLSGSRKYIYLFLREPKPQSATKNWKTGPKSMQVFDARTGRFVEWADTESIMEERVARSGVKEASYEPGLEERIRTAREKRRAEKAARRAERQQQ